MQEILEPIFSSIIFNEEYKPAEVEQVAYSFLLGAPSAGVLEGGDVIGQDVAIQRSGAELREVGDETIDAVIATGLESDKSTASYEIAMQLQALRQAGEKLTDYDLGRLYAENIQTVAAEEQAARKERESAKKTWIENASTRLEETEAGTELVSERKWQPPVREPGALPTAEQTIREQQAAEAPNDTRASGIYYGASDEDITSAERLGMILGRPILFYAKEAGKSGIENGY